MRTLVHTEVSDGKGAERVVRSVTAKFIGGCRHVCSELKIAYLCCNKLMKYIMTAVTVLMPFYNGKEYLDESVRSALAQTYPHVKILIGVNGNSQDSEEWRLAASYAKTNPNVTTKHYTVPSSTYNKKSYTLNKMVLDVDTELVCILDVDDIWLPTKLAEQMLVWEDKHYDVVGTKWQCLSNDPIRNGTIPLVPSGALDNFDFTKLSIRLAISTP